MYVYMVVNIKKTFITVREKQYNVSSRMNFVLFVI